MSRVTFSPAAIADIDGIWDYTVEMWVVDQAEHYTDGIRGTCNALAAGGKEKAAPLMCVLGISNTRLENTLCSLWWRAMRSLSFAFFISIWMQGCIFDRVIYDGLF